MKKVLVILSVVVILIVVILLTIPVFFRGNIVKIIENQSARYIRAELKIGDLSLSMFKSFPDLNVALKNVTIAGEGEFAEDTIVNIPLFEASVNLKSLISGDELIVNRVFLKDGRLLPTVNTVGKANWDIMIHGDTVSAEEIVSVASETASEKTEKGLSLKDISIENLYIAYHDYKNSQYASVGAINLNLSGNFSESNTMIRVLLALKDISYRHQNSVWVNKTDLNWQAEIAANLKELTFDILKNDLAINDLKLNLIGNVAVVNERYNLDLQLNAPDTQFESLLALVPKTLQHYIKGLETQGDFKFNVVAKGEYYTNHLPALRAKLLVKDAWVKYPELPEAIKKINIDVNVSNPGGPVDSTAIDVKKVAFEIAGNPFQLFLKMVNPNDPLLDGGAVGVIDFASLKKAVPLKDVTLEGMMTTDVTFKGKYQYIEKEQYEKFVAKGSVVFKNILFRNTEFPDGVAIPGGSIVITPAYLNLNKLQAKVYSSDFLLQGNISNYLPYLFKNEMLKGNFALTSERINLNEFLIAQMKAAKADTTQVKQDTVVVSGQPSAAEGVFEIPKNIDVHITADVNTIIFDRLMIRNMKGNIGFANAVADLRNLSLDMLKGNMVLNGQYNTVDPKNPNVNFKLKVSDFDINEAYNSFTFIKKSVPVALNCEGKVSAEMKFAARLDKEMSPVMTTANGGGYLESQSILIKDNPAMNQLASILKNDELSRLSISHLKINFKLENGNIVVEPFKTTFAGNPVTIYGKQSVEGDLDYTLSMTVNRKFFGNEINNLLKSIPGSKNIQNLDIDAKVGGTLIKPVIKPDLSKAIKAVTKEAEKELKGNVLQGLQNLFKKK